MAAAGTDTVRDNVSTNQEGKEIRRMKTRWAMAILAASALMSGCAFQAQAVKIHADVRSAGIVDGGGKAVRLAVVDERPSKVIGQRGVGGAGADMTVEGDLISIVFDAIASGLGQRHFSPSKDAFTGGSTLRVEIRNLDSKNIMGFWAGTLRDEFSLKGICKSARGSDYEDMYNGLFETSVQVVPTGEANDRYVSSAVSDSVSKLVSDNSLLRCLAE
jgi:uncharacterized lipoprotein YajG